MSEQAKVWRLGVLGAGTVGGAFIKAVEEQAEAWERRGLGRVRVERVLVRDRQRARSLPVAESAYTTNVEEVVGRADIDVVVSLIGGTTPATGHMRRALTAGQHVITANKAVIAASGPDLEAVALEKGVALLYEAAVGGGVPIIRPLKTHFIPNGVRRIEAILNGTCNFILSQMRGGTTFAAALAQAQSEGLAEADPSMDIDGVDTAQKLAILATMSFGRRYNEKAVVCRGIRQIDAADLKFAQANGLGLILLATATLHRGEGAALSVMPTLVGAGGGLARAQGPNNILSLATDIGGPYDCMGLGAGDATAASVVADLASLLTGAWRGELPGALSGAAPYEPPAVLPYSAHPHGWYVRCADSAATEAVAARLAKGGRKVGRPAGAMASTVLEIADISYTELLAALGDTATTAAIAQYHPGERPSSLR